MDAMIVPVDDSELLGSSCSRSRFVVLLMLRYFKKAEIGNRETNADRPSHSAVSISALSVSP